MNVEKTERFEAYGVVSLFGHKTIAGRITEQTIGGETFIRVDVPHDEGDGYYTQLFGKGAIYSISLTDEAIVREYAKRSTKRPVQAYDVAQLLKDNPPAPALPQRVAVLDDDRDYDDDDERTPRF